MDSRLRVSIWDMKKNKSRLRPVRIASTEEIRAVAGEQLRTVTGAGSTVYSVERPVVTGQGLT